MSRGLESPYTVQKGVMPVIVQENSMGLSAAFALMGTRAEEKVAIRITGGCSGMSLADKEDMLRYFSEALPGYKGVLSSGGTRNVKDGKVDPMVTDVPGVVSELNKGCIVLGTAPRTAVLSLQGESRLVLDEYGTAPNPCLDGLMIVQSGPDAALDWDGDLDKYFSLMEYWKAFAGFSRLGIISWNGGAVTEKEILGSMKRGWTVILVEGTGRKTDEIIEKVRNRELESSSTHIVSKEHPKELRDVLVTNGFISRY
jgi:hypothetical protein